MASESNCGKCSKVLPAEGKFLVCTECDVGFHFGKNCAGIAENAVSGKGAAKRETWLCRDCRSQNHTAAGVDAAPNYDSLSELSAKIEILLPLKDAISSLVLKVDELLQLKSTVDVLQKSVDSVQETVNFVSGKYDEVIATSATQQATVEQLKSEVHALKSTVSDQAEELASLRKELNNVEQYSRRANLEIHGLPQHKGEKLLPIISDLAQKLELNFTESDIEAIHRLPANRDRPPVLLVRFASPTLKELWWNCRGSLRALAEQDMIPQLYFSENLTNYNRDLYWAARQKGKEKLYKYVWAKHGKIFAKKAEKSSLVRIQDYADLDKLV